MVSFGSVLLCTHILYSIIIILLFHLLTCLSLPHIASFIASKFMVLQVLAIKVHHIILPSYAGRHKIMIFEGKCFSKK